MKKTALLIIWNVLKWAFADKEVMNNVYMLVSQAEESLEGGSNKKNWVLSMLNEEPYRSSIVGLSSLLINWIIETAVVRLRDGK